MTLPPSRRAILVTGAATLKQIGKPEEVAEAIHWLMASGSMMTGSLVDLDFGMPLKAT